MFNRPSFIKKELGARTLLDRFTTSRFYSWLDPERRFKRIHRVADKLQSTSEATLRKL